MIRLKFHDYSPSPSAPCELLSGSAAFFGESDDIAGRVFEQRHDDRARKLGALHHYFRAELLCVLERFVDVGNLHVDGDPGTGVLTRTDTAWDATCGLGVDNSVVVLVVRIDIPVKQLAIELFGSTSLRRP